MARACLLLFATTAMLASRLGQAVSLKYSEDRNSFGDSSLSMDMPAKNFPFVKNTFQWPASKGSPVVLAAPVAHVTEVKATVAPEASKVDPGDVMSQLTVQVNKSLTSINSSVASLVDNLEQKKTQLKLLAQVNTTWALYLNQLSSTLLDAEDQVVKTLLAMQALIDLLIPPDDAPTDAMGPMSGFADGLHEAARLARELQNLTYTKSVLNLGALNSTLYNGSATAFNGSSKLESDLVLLADRMYRALQQLPMPGVVMATTQKMFDMAKETAKNFHTQFDRAVSILVSGVEEASFKEFSTVPKSSFISESGASRVAPLLAAMLAVGAVAFY